MLKGGEVNALKTSGITQSTTNKVPEKLAEEESPEARPYRICIGINTQPLYKLISES